MVRFILIILVLVQIVEQENPGLSNTKLQRKLKGIHKHLSEPIKKPTSEDYRRCQQESKKISIVVPEVFDGSFGQISIYKIRRGQDIFIGSCSVLVRGFLEEKDIRSLRLNKRGSDLPKNSYFKKIVFSNMSQDTPSTTLVDMLIKFVDVQEDDAGNYTCSIETGREVHIVRNSRLQLEVNSKRDEHRLTLAEPFKRPCVVRIIDIDHTFDQSDFTVNFEWYQNSKRIEDDGVHITISEVYYELKHELHQFTSFLSISKMTESLYGKYLCKGLIYDQSGNREKPELLRIVEKLYYLRPLHWRKQARKLASVLPDSLLHTKPLQILSAKVFAQRQKALRQVRRLNLQNELCDQIMDATKVYEDTAWKLLHRNARLQEWYEDVSDLFLQLSVNFLNWVIGVVSSILVSIKIYQYIRRKLKENEMKKHYALLEKIAALGLTFRHQCSSYDYDVVISSCEDDENFVEDQLLPKIRTEWHLRKYYSEEDELIGVDIISNMSEKIHKSRKTLVVLSQKFIESSWSVHELCLAYHRKFLDSKDSLVILHLSDLIDNPLELEPLLQGNNYIDFRKGSTEKAWNKLKHALIKGRKSKRN